MVCVHYQLVSVYLEKNGLYTLPQYLVLGRPFLLVYDSDVQFPVPFLKHKAIIWKINFRQ
jgi:hypothetical protein